MQPFDAIVFDAGGTRGLASVSAYARIMQSEVASSLLQQAPHVVGSSVGALVALGVALNAPADVLLRELRELDFKKFLHWTPMRLMQGCFRDFGIYSGARLQRFAESLCRRFGGGKATLTFRQLYERTRRSLIVCATNVNLGRKVFFEHLQFPHMPVAVAVRASMSVPFLFDSQKYKGPALVLCPASGMPMVCPGDTLVDGGTFGNLPLDYYTDHNLRILTFDFVSSPTYRPRPVENLADFVRWVGHGVLASTDALMERLYGSTFPNMSVVKIDVTDTSSLDFDVTAADKKVLYNAGRTAAVRWLQNAGISR